MAFFAFWSINTALWVAQLLRQKHPERQWTLATLQQPLFVLYVALTGLFSFPFYYWLKFSFKRSRRDDLKFVFSIVLTPVALLILVVHGMASTLTLGAAATLLGKAPLSAMRTNPAIKKAMLQFASVTLVWATITCLLLFLFGPASSVFVKKLDAMGAMVVLL
ncbi:MAG: hypothetical protein GY822_25745 [Deltaproteobacteria bacterium]|nr:hypothetical protein [Deltaproteobacteria bacterium]